MARKALLVGINDYQSINDLRGCLNDVTNMRDVLKSLLGFTNADISVLTDTRATKNNILARLNWMVNGARPGDYLVFHYSGHGSQIRDRDGDERLSDSLDELVCPWDMDWNLGTYITDDELNTLFRRLPPNVLLEVYLDSCHSGTGLRDFEAGRPAELAPEHTVVNRYAPPPVDLLCRFEGDEDTLTRKRLFRHRTRDTVNHILWAGCQDNQTSADAHLGGAYNGAFSYYFCKAMRDTRNRLSRAEVLARVRASLRFNGFAQTPQLETEATIRDTRAPSTKDEDPVKKTSAGLPAISVTASRSKAQLKTAKSRATTLVRRGR